MTELHNIKSRLQSARDSNEISRLLTESKVSHRYYGAYISHSQCGLQITLSNLGLLVPINDKDLSGLSDASQCLDLSLMIIFNVCIGDILEFGALHSISVKDINSFERYVGILQNFYINLKLALRFAITYTYIYLFNQ